jgi:hypothetical protein
LFIEFYLFPGFSQNPWFCKAIQRKAAKKRRKMKKSREQLPTIPHVYNTYVLCAFLSHTIKTQKYYTIFQQSEAQNTYVLSVFGGKSARRICIM